MIINAVYPQRKDPKLENLSATSNGTYSPGFGTDGFSKVVVEIPVYDYSSREVE